MNQPVSQTRAAVIGGGPAGLMAAEMLLLGGVQVDLYDAMPSVARKFLLAGKGGMNITHAEPHDAFTARYGERKAEISPLLEAFGPRQLRVWLKELGIATFVGSSGRVFPVGMKAAPLLRAWLHRLREAGLRIHVRQRWQGWNDDGSLRFVTADGERTERADVVVLALGGGSWAKLGSNGAWVPWLTQRGVKVTPLRPANCGFEVANGWSAHFCQRFAGQPVKSVVASAADPSGAVRQLPGEFMVTATGVEGSLIYALSAALRDEIAASKSATLVLDLAPGWTLPRLVAEIARPRGSRSISSHLQSRVGLKGVKTGLLRELLPAATFADAAALATAIKALPLRLAATRPLDEAISSAGGVTFAAIDENLMLRNLPGVFCAGEMLDWEAPTGGYLLTACFASGRAAGLGALVWLNRPGMTSA
jgi:uncharacterized flavoprotein (TIGR03862 family)